MNININRNRNRNKIFIGSTILSFIIPIIFLTSVSIANSNLNGIFYLYYEDKNSTTPKKYYDKNIYLVIKDDSLIYYSNDQIHIGWKINRKTQTINNLESIEYRYSYFKAILTFDKNSYVKRDSPAFRKLHTLQ